MKALHLGLALWLLVLASPIAAQTCPAGNPRIAPNSRYIASEPVAGQHIVQDQRTGLTWKRCLQGFTGANCATGTEVFNSWSVALSIADDEVFAGHSDWRLPTINELRTLVETGCHNPAINTAVFSNLNSPQVWSSTTYVSFQPTAWGVTFTNGESVVIGKSGGGSIRLVRGGQPLSSFNSGLDYTPDGYSFSAQNAVPVSTLRVSNTIIVGGITTPTGIGISGAAGSQYRINGGTWTSAPGEVNNGDSVDVRHSSAATLAAATTTTLGIGGISANFVSTTVSGGCPATVVTNGNDSGSGSLREIIATACPASTVTFQAGVSTVTLTSAELLVSQNLTINGGSGVTVSRSTAAGTPQFRIFNVQSGNNVNINGLTVSNGDHPVQAGGILNSGILTLNNMQISGNRAPQGGGLQNDSVLNLSNTSLVNNTANLIGGGLAIFGSSTILSNCTVAGNVAGNSSGGIFTAGNIGPLSITNCSIVDNRMVNTFEGAGAGINGNSVSVLLRNTIIAGNTNLRRNIPSDIFGDVQPTSAFNVIGSGGSGGLTNGVNNNQVGVSATALLFGPLGNYGGPTSTVPLLPGSVAINAGTSISAPVVDQRGIARPQLAAVDVGAYESRGFNLSIAGGNNQTTLITTAFAAPLSVSVTANGAGERVQGGIVNFTSLGIFASATFASNPATIDVSGVASTVATANGTGGSYSVLANANGNSGGAVSFALENNATLPTLSIDDVTAVEGNSGTTQFDFTVSVSSPTLPGGVRFDIATANGTASAGSDFLTQSLTGQVVPAGNSRFTVLVNGDNISEANETFFLNLSNVVGATVVDGEGLGTIINDDVHGITVVQSNGTTNVTEGGTTDSFTVVLTSQPEADVQIAVDGGTQVTAAPVPLSFTAANWNVPQIVTVTAIDDALFESNPHPGSVGFTVTSTDAGYSGFVVPVVDVTVTDNDPAPTISISSPSLPEGNAGTSVMNFVVSLSAVSGLPVNFIRETQDGSATASSDYVALAATPASIPAGQISVTIAVTINGDTVFEGDETFTLLLRTITNATPSPTISGTGTILEDDQQPTTTTIVSDLPDPTVVGQPYTVAVQVAASSSSPLGSVSISDGTGGTCGPVTLVAGTSPNSTASCDVTSTSIGAKTLTATYTPASSAFAAGSGTTSHQVNAAATTLSVTGPPRSQINTPSSFSFALAASAPGGGVPAGAVTLTSGGSSCQVTMPTATPNCTLSFGALGPATVTAAFVPGNANYLATSSSGAGNAQTTVFALSNLSISKDDGITSAAPGDSVSYVITARNAGPNDAPGTTVSDTFPAACSSVTWTCVGAGGANCTASGSGNIAEVVSLPSGASVAYTAACAIDVTASGALINTASVAVGANVDDLDLTNNSATDTDALTPQANLVAMLTAPTQVTPGFALNYSASARNDGLSNAEDVQLAVSFGSAGQFASVTPSAGGTCTTPAFGAAGNVVCRWMGLTTVGETRSLSGVLFSQANGTLELTATASSTTPDPVIGNNVGSASVTVGNGAGVPPAMLIPVTDRLTLALLALLLGLAGWVGMRRRG